MSVSESFRSDVFTAVSPFAEKRVFIWLLIPDRAVPCDIIESPMTTTRMAPHFNTCFVKCLPRPATIEPNPSSSGMVPSAKKNIDSAPVNGLAEANATICIDCRGPQGIRPLNKPMIKGVLRLWEALLLFEIPFEASFCLPF